MRWLFLILLALNVGYLAWELNHETPQRAAATALPAGAARIVLLSELEAETAAKQAGVTPASAAASAPQAGIAAMVDDSSTASALAEDDKAQTPPTRIAAASDGAVAEMETKAANKPDDAGRNRPANKPKDEPGGDKCYTLGPFSEMKSLRQVTREIKDYVVEASFRSRQEQEQSMFRVLLRPVSNKQEAKALIKQLVSKNIRDYFVITDGPNKDGISLGYFSEKGRAHRHAERIRKLGFDAITEPVFRSYTIYWLDYRIKAGNEIPAQIFDQYLENSAQRLGRSCN